MPPHSSKLNSNLTILMMKVYIDITSSKGNFYKNHQNLNAPTYDPGILLLGMYPMDNLTHGQKGNVYKDSRRL